MISRPERTPVASDLYTYCTKEKIETWHVVRSHNAQGLVERVICKSCNSEHKFRNKNASTTRSSSRSVVRRTPGKSAAAPAPSSESLRETWFMKLKAWGDKDVLNYNPQESFLENDIIKHSTFGKGSVEKLRGSRMDVLFESGMKVLPVKKKVLEF